MLAQVMGSSGAAGDHMMEESGKYRLTKSKQGYVNC